MSNEERRNYYGDVEYEVWRRGGNPDCVDRDRLDHYREQELTVSEAAQLEREHQRPVAEAKGDE